MWGAGGTGRGAAAPERTAELRSWGFACHHRLLCTMCSLVHGFAFTETQKRGGPNVVVGTGVCVPAIDCSVFCIFPPFHQNESPVVTSKTIVAAGTAWCLAILGVSRARTYGAAPLVAHLLLRAVAHTGLPPVLGLRAVADARPLTDAAGTGDGAGRPRGPGAPAAVDCGESRDSVSRGALQAGQRKPDAGSPMRQHLVRSPWVTEVGPRGRGSQLVCSFLSEERSQPLRV